MSTFPTNLFQNIADLYRAVHIWESGLPQIDIHRYEEAYPYMTRVKLGNFRCNFYQLSLLCQGAVTLNVSYQRINIPTGSLIITGPNHLQTWADSVSLLPIKGYILFFSEDFLSLSPQSTLLLRDFGFLKPHAQIVVPLPPDQLRLCQSIYEKILHEYASKHSDMELVIQNYINILLVYSKRNHSSLTPVLVNHTPSPTVQLLHKFTGLVDQTMIVQQNPFRTIESYADELCVHPYYLNRIIKQLTGKSASAFVAQRLTVEAKSLLFQSKMSISEVAYQLGFNDSSHFIKFFRRNTGLTLLPFVCANKFG